MAGIDLPAGCQQLKGRNALGYVRTRDTPRADLDRMINQRQFMSALLHRAASPAVWLNPWRWYSVPHAAADALTVDQGDHVWDLARLGWALHGSTTAMTVPIGEFTSSDVGLGGGVEPRRGRASCSTRWPPTRRCPPTALEDSSSDIVRATRRVLITDNIQRNFNIGLLYLGKPGLS